MIKAAAAADHVGTGSHHGRGGLAVLAHTLGSRSVPRGYPIRRLADLWSAVGAARATMPKLPIPKCLNSGKRAAWRRTLSCRLAMAAGLLFEVNIGNGRVDAGARNVLRVAERVETERMGRRSAQVAIVSSGYLHTLADGLGPSGPGHRSP